MVFLPFLLFALRPAPYAAEPSGESGVNRFLTAFGGDPVEQDRGAVRRAGDKVQTERIILVVDAERVDSGGAGVG